MLYSDSSMSWMTGDFIKVWASLMTACLKNGTRIKIIHNVERSVNEMTNAIISWMPLYLSGLIEPYYSTSPAGSRYSCTIFIDPENACVHSFGVREGAAETEYFYFTDEERIDRGIGDFEALISKCSPLLEVLPVSDPNENTKVCDIGSVRLYIEENSITVNKLEEPTAAFRFTYPPMCKAFKSFADAIETGRELL